MDLLSTLLDTPTEKYEINKQVPIYVKREDQACLPPGPPFAKVRGVYPYLQKLKARGIKTVGYVDTTVSMAGIGISFFCQLLGLKAVIFEPIYKGGYKDLQEEHRKKWQDFGANVEPIMNPGRMNNNISKAREILSSKYPDSWMIPQGLKLEETTEEVAKQVRILPEDSLGGSLVVAIGSGTMAAGILRGLVERKAPPTKIYGVLSFPKNLTMTRNKIELKSGCLEFDSQKYEIVVMDLGYKYTEKENEPCPFPCSPYYDRKAWAWLIREGIHKLTEPILFWNIGA